MNQCIVTSFCEPLFHTWFMSYLRALNIIWIAGIDPNNVVSYFCVFDHVVAAYVCRLHIILLPLIVLVDTCTLVSNHLMLHPPNDAESTPNIDVWHHLLCTIKDIVLNILEEVGCPDMQSKPICENVVVDKPGACEVIDHRILLSKNLEFMMHDNGSWAHPLDVKNAWASWFHPPIPVKSLFVAHAPCAMCSYGCSTQQLYFHVIVPESRVDDVLRQMTSSTLKLPCIRCISDLQSMIGWVLPSMNLYMGGGLWMTETVPGPAHFTFVKVTEGKKTCSRNNHIKVLLNVPLSLCSRIKWKKLLLIFFGRT